MKKLILLFIALIFSLGLFSQAKYQAKIVVLFMGEKNVTFDEEMFPNCQFYYTPGITATEKKANTIGGKIAGSITGDDYSTAYDVSFSGSPEAAYQTKMTETVLFDINGYVSGLYKSFSNIVLNPKKNLQGTYTFADYNSVSKDYIKKGNQTKEAKKAPKNPKHLFDYYGMEIPSDFEVENAAGEKKSLRSIVKGEPLTILHTLYVSPNADFSGRDINSLKTLFELEENIFGKKVEL